jgi:predicted nucleic acid-binding protein
VIRYFDASALVKRYVREAGSVTVRRLLTAGTAASRRLSEVEVSSGIVRRVPFIASTDDWRRRLVPRV